MILAPLGLPTSHRSPPCQNLRGAHPFEKLFVSSIISCILFLSSPISFRFSFSSSANCLQRLIFVIPAASLSNDTESGLEVIKLITWNSRDLDSARLGPPLA